MSQHRIFLSHSHEDNDLCDRYHRALAERGYDVWYDRVSMRGGHTLSHEIQRELQQRDVFLVLLTPTSVKSFWVDLETAAFRDLAAHDLARLMLPVRALPCDIPLLLRGVRTVDAYDQPFEAAIEEICRAIEAPRLPPFLDEVPRLTGMSRRNALLALAGGVAAIIGTSVALATALSRGGAKESGTTAGAPTPTATPEPSPTPTAPLSGSLLWSFQTRGEIAKLPILVGDTLYVGSFDSYAYAIDAASGAERWRFKTGAQVNSTPAWANGLIFVGSADQTLYALHEDTGKQVWTYATKGPIISSLISENFYVYLIAEDKLLRAVYVMDGGLAWSFPAVGGTASLGLDNHSLYVCDSDFVARDPHSGQEQWRGTVDASVYGPPALADGAVYVGSSYGVYGVNGSTGAVLWRYVPEAEVFSGVAIGDGVVYFSAIGHPYVTALIAETGNFLWRFKAPLEKEFWTPAYANGVVYSGNYDGYLYAIDGKTGSQRWAYQADSAITSGVIVVNGVVYFGTQNGMVYAVRA